jgi:hypothetical protein
MKIKVKKGEKITVELARKKPIDSKSKVQNPVEPAKGILRPRREAEYLARRRKTDLLINFYDLGQIKNSGGDFIDLDFSIQPALTVTDHRISDIAVMTNLEALALNEKLFEIPVEQWKDNYKKLSYEEAEKYGIDLYLGSREEFEPAKYYPVARVASRGQIQNEEETVENSKWTSQGLKINKPIQTGFEIYSALGFNSFRTDHELIKITAENDYDGAEATLTLDAAADIFLVPALYLVSVKADETTAPFQTDYLDLSYRPLQREFFLDFVPFGSTQRTLFASRLADQTESFEAISPAKASDIAEQIKDSPNARLHRSTGSADSFVSPASFSFLNTNRIRFQQYAENLLFAYVRFAPGSLLAVVRKGGACFFIWAREALEPAGSGFDVQFNS